MAAFDDALDAILSGARPRDIESQVLEFKEEQSDVKRTLENLADAVVCMANSDGGVIVLGIADAVAGPDALRGVSPDMNVAAIVRGIFERTRPALSVPVALHRRNGRLLAEITVPVGATFYANAKGTATRRVNDECRPFPPDEQRQALASRGLYDWSAQSSGVLDFAEEELHRVRRLLREADRPELAAQDSTALLSDLRLLAADGALTNAALLLIGRPDDIAACVPSYGYSYQYRVSPGSEASARFRGGQALLGAVAAVLDAVEARSSLTPLNVSGGVQVQRQDYPVDAVRELVINAFVHRDYEAEGSVDVEQSPQSLHIVSPGGLVFGVTADNILSHPSTPRNRLLLETVTTLQVAERSGQGVDRAYRALLRTGKKPPAFIDSGSSVDVVLPGGAGDDAYTRYVRTQLPEELALDIEALLILDALCVQRRITAAVVAPVIQRSTIDAQRALERLVTADVVQPTKRTALAAFPNYELTVGALTGLGLAVSYHRRKADGADEKVIDHIREYGFVTNQTLRRLFDMELYPARNMLRDLQERGLVQMLEPGARGPGVKYGPGPVFPKSRRR